MLCIVVSRHMVINRVLKEDNGYCGENGKQRKNVFSMHVVSAINYAPCTVIA